MAESLFGDPKRLVLGTRKVPSSYTDQDVPWGISHVDRRNHLYIVGKTGMGKTASIMAPATPFCFCAMQKRLTFEITRHSGVWAIILSGRKWPTR